MTRSATSTALSAVLLAGLASGAGAGLAARGPAILTMTNGARSQALGGVDGAWVDGADAIPANPAALLLLQQPEAQFSHGEAFAGQSLNIVRFARPRWSPLRKSAWGLSGAYLSQGAVEVIRDENAFGTATPFEAVWSLSYAQFLGGLRLGANVHWVQQKITTERSGGPAVDLGLLGYETRDGARWSLALMNEGPPLRTGGESTPLPLQIRLGASAPLRFASFGASRRLRLGAQIDWPSGDRAVPRGGIEYLRLARQWRFALRGGYDQPTAGSGRAHLGFGLERKAFRLDYVFHPQTQDGASQQFDVAWRFGNPAAPNDSRDDRLETLVREIRVALQERRPLEARRRLEEIRALAPAAPHLKRLQRDIDRQLAESLDPPTLMQQGRQALTEGRFEHSAEIFQKVLAIDPARVEARDALAQAMDQAARARAERVRREVETARQRDRKRWTERAQAHMRDHRWEEAWSAWEQVTALSNGSAAPPAERERCRAEIFAAAERQEADGHLAEAARRYRLIQGADPAGEAARRASRLEAALQKSRRAEAEQLFESGMRAYQERDGARARDLFMKARSLNPEDQNIRKALERLDAEKF